MSAHRAPAASKRSPGRRGTPHEVRIIGGQWRRTKLPVADRPGLRPTPDRVRETLFNWLGQDLTGWRCVDAFAGSGALGFEAASRGAADVWLIEQDARLVAALAALKEKLHADAVRVQRGDGVGALARCAAASLDLVFLDPPFEAHDLLISALRAAARAVRSGGWIYLEAPQPIVAGVLAANGLDLHRRLKAGAVHAHVLTPIADRTA
jgi:16S rRNA (guanine(966)-N(2))-methyltransferase RsmD